ncbi:MAG: glutamate formiminotransferase [Chloroflexi bacterium]|nr:MAG: glutamate formiminotransferase [Chloroflexota bacterium]
MIELFESVPNFSEGRRDDVIADLAALAAPAHLLDVDADPDHNRVVITLAGSAGDLSEALLGAILVARKRIDLRAHHGVHPRIGAADVVPIVPLGDASLDRAREVAHELGEQVWTELRVPVYFYGHGEGRTLADIRAGRVPLSLGGPALHPTAGAVSIGARPPLVAFNVILYDTDLVAARALARSIRESGAGLRGVQALAFPLSGERVQLSMNLFRVDVTSPADVIAELERRGVAMGAEQVVGLCPAAAATAAASGRLLEGRLAAAAARPAARQVRLRGREEHNALADRLQKEADGLYRLAADQDEMLAGAERAAAIVRVLAAAGVTDEEVDTILLVAARGLRKAITPATAAVYKARVDALDARLG